MNPLYAHISTADLLVEIDQRQREEALEMTEVIRLLETQTCGGADDQYADFYACAEQFLDDEVQS